MFIFFILTFIFQILTEFPKNNPRVPWSRVKCWVVLNRLIFVLKSKSFIRFVYSILYFLNYLRKRIFKKLRKIFFEWFELFAGAFSIFWLSLFEPFVVWVRAHFNNKVICRFRANMFLFIGYLKVFHFRFTSLIK